MADIRINALATTAASTASDDFIAVDGSANGTRKLNAYSPTFGGNLTVSGTGVSTFSSEIAANKSGSNISFSALGSTVKSGLWTNADGTMTWGDYATGTKSLKLNTTTGDATLSGNLTVSGTQMQMGGVNPFIQGTTGAGYIQFQNAGDVVVASNTGKLVLIANGSTRATVATTGNFLIGTTTDGGQKLQVNGTAYVSGDATFAGTIALTGSSAGQVATWNSSNANGIYHTYLTNGTAIGDIGSAAQAVSGSASDFGITSRAGKLVLGTSSAARVTIDTSGNLIAAVTGTAPTLGTNSTMTFELTSNTSLTIKVRGTDGTTRSVALTLA